MTAYTMSVVEGSAYPGQVSVEILNATDAEIDSGNEGDFFVQAERDGQWYALETLQDEYANTAEAYVYETDVSRELTLNWTAYYGSLSRAATGSASGFSSTGGPGDTTDFLLAAEFHPGIDAEPLCPFLPISGGTPRGIGVFAGDGRLFVNFFRNAVFSLHSAGKCGMLFLLFCGLSRLLNKYR